jgi:DNA invertase Pin-like site-specific DNA recombinase
MIIAGCYARKSNEDDRNEEAKSTQRQVDRAREFARSKGWTFSEQHVWIDDGISGAEWRDRHAFNAMLTALDTTPPPINVLIVSELSRIGRDTVRTPGAVLQIEECGVQIWAYLTSQQISLADETGEINTIFNSLAASFERRKAYQRVTDALRRRAERGQIAGGKAPFGYEQYKNGDVVKRRIREDQALVVKRIFQDTANGDGLARIAKALNKEHISAPTPKGTKLYRNGRWIEATGDWTATAIAEILHQRRFLGIETYGRTRRVKRRGSTKRREASPDRVIEVKVPDLAIVDEATWDAAHAAKAARRGALLRSGNKLQGRKESLNGKYLLSNHLACGGRKPDGTLCGAPLVAVKRGSNMVLGYACRARQASGPSACDNGTSVPAEAIHAGVVAALRSTFTAERFEQHLQLARGRR